MLDQVASTAVVSLSNPWLWVTGVLLLVGSLAVAYGGGKAWITGVLLAIGFVIAYLLIRRQVLSIASAGATIRFDIAGVEKTEIRAIMDKIEATQAARFH